MTLSHRVIFLCVLFLFITLNDSNAQVGVGTTSPQAELDITSANAGILIPRFALNSSTDVTTVTNPNGGDLAVSTLVFNDGTGDLTPAGFYYWNGVNWVLITGDSTRNVFFGTIFISSTGSITISEIPFQPSSVSFTAYANVDSFNLDDDNGVGNNNNGINNAFGGMEGFAQSFVGSITQQVIYGGGSGSSINDISRFASNSHCIGLRYSNNNGNNLGTTTASVTSFTENGFILNVDNADDDVIVIYKAYR